MRDKDGISALVAIAALAAECAERRETLLDRLRALYREHGVFVSAQRSLALAPGQPELGALLRKSPPASIGGRRVGASRSSRSRDEYLQPTLE